MAVSLHAIPPVLVSAALLVYPETIKAPLQWHVIGNKTQVKHDKCNKRKMHKCEAHAACFGSWLSLQENSYDKDRK